MVTQFALYLTITAILVIGFLREEKVAKWEQKMIRKFKRMLRAFFNK